MKTILVTLATSALVVTAIAEEDVVVTYADRLDSGVCQQSIRMVEWCYNRHNDCPTPTIDLESGIETCASRLECFINMVGYVTEDSPENNDCINDWIKTLLTKQSN